MKKNQVKKLKKLWLSRETLRDLKSEDTRKVVAGATPSTVSYDPADPDPCGGAG